MLDKALDKAYESRSLDKILDAPVAAQAGVSDGDAEHLAAAFGIKTVRDLGEQQVLRDRSGAGRAEQPRRLKLTGRDGGSGSGRPALTCIRL